MKKLILTLSVLAMVSGLLITSCNKYPDGPKFSLLSKKTRLSGEWSLKKYTVNDVDKTSEFLTANGDNYMLDIEKKGGYTVSGKLPDSGTWELGEDKDDVRFQSSTAGKSEISFRITKLENKDLWMHHTESNGDVLAFQYSQ